MRHHCGAAHRDPVDVERDGIGVDAGPRCRERIVHANLVEDQDQRVATACKRPVFRVQFDLELTPVGGPEAYPPALVVHVDREQVAQIRAAPGRRPAYAAGKETRLVKLEPGVARDLVLELVVGDPEMALAIPVEILAHEQPVVDVARLVRRIVATGVAFRATDELRDLTAQHEVAAGIRFEIVDAQARDEARRAVQVAKARGVAQRVLAHAHAAVAVRLEPQQHLAPQVLRIVVQELLGIEHVVTEPGQRDARHERAHAQLGALRAPCVAATLENELLGGVVDPRPPGGERGDIVGRRGPGDLERGDRNRRESEGPQGVHPGGFATRISPSCAVLAISLPSRACSMPRVKPRAPEALGLSIV